MLARDDDGRLIDCGDDDDATCPAPAWIDDVAYAAKVRLCSARAGGPSPGPMALPRLRAFLGLLERDDLPSPLVYLSAGLVVVEWGGKVGVAVDGEPGPLLPRRLTWTLLRLRKRLERRYPRRRRPDPA